MHTKNLPSEEYLCKHGGSVTLKEQEDMILSEKKLSWKCRQYITKFKNKIFSDDERAKQTLEKVNQAMTTPEVIYLLYNQWESKNYIRWII